ncbi:uncharacterized protein AB675_9939 [Cyphellophora attinorum]|uniref:Uncharacterized protein n=1 Tax=Cyphellophora attinorum TaxID=1664694 RepID=A0A0N1HHL6_9EURO|nr:uncharacterized protein AB675_9939 [Phialophora attinorum]KPI35314.1 hypothetical protein AB675_9939 [Phialophora attinorum]
MSAFPTLISSRHAGQAPAMYTDHATQTDSATMRSVDHMAAASTSTSQARLPISLKCLAIASDFERKLPLYFTLRQELLTNPSPANCPDSTTSLLLRLPYDVLHLIFHSIAHAPSQICFLLTCKTLLLTLSPSPLPSSTANTSSTLDSAGPNPLPLTLSTISPKYAGHLPTRVFDVPCLLRQLSPTVPSHLRLCAHCLTHRPFGPPSDTEYWPLVQGCGDVANFWVRKTGWEFFGGGWNKVVHDICPYVFTLLSISWFLSSSNPSADCICCPQMTNISGSVTLM